MHRYLYSGISILGCATVLFEIALTRIFSITLWYHFAYFIIALALFGMSVGAIIAFYIVRRFDLRKSYGVLTYGSLINAWILLFIVLIISNVDFSPSGIVTTVASFAILFLLCQIPFIIFGLILGILFKHKSSSIGALYASDLIGASIACPIFIVLIWNLSGPQIIIVCALLCVVSFALLLKWSTSRSVIYDHLKAIISLLLIFYIGFFTDYTDLKFTKTYVDRADKIFERWSPLNRITVYPGVFWKSMPDQPFLWGPGKHIDSLGSVEQLWVEQDAQAGTPITKFHGDFNQIKYLSKDITSFAYHISEFKNVYIIGSGGGRDVLTSLYFNVAQIDGSEINKVIVNLVKNEFDDYAGGIYNNKRVNIEVADARSAIRRSGNRYDLIQFSFIDSWAATMAGALSLSENNLYTKEAFVEYLNHLSPNGTLSISRYLFEPRNQTLRVVTTARSALHQLGVELTHRHIVVLGTSMQKGVSNTIVKKQPFTSNELNKIDSLCRVLGFEILYSWKAPKDLIFKKVLETKDFSDQIESYYYDIRPTSDQRPFFFQLTYFSNVSDLIFSNKGITGQMHNYYAHLVIIILLILGLVFVTTLIFIPTYFRKNKKNQAEHTRLLQHKTVYSIYFIGIAISFMLIEVVLIQYGTLFLEHPTHSFLTILTSMLLFAGMGSYCSSYIKEKIKVSKFLIIALGLITLFMAIFIDDFIKYGLTFSITYKVLLFGGLTSLVAFMMGFLFPLGIRSVDQLKMNNNIPWIWALNGSGSVLGSTLAMFICMTLGYNYALVAAALIYLIIAIALHRQRTFQGIEFP